MPTTTNWDIEYPNGTTAPNVPAVMQAQAESVEAALNTVAKAPLIICTKLDNQSLASANTVYDVNWDAETHSQGITHNPGDSTFIVSETGIYQVNTRVAFNGETVIGTILISVNGLSKNESLSDEIGGPNAWPKPIISQYVKLNAGDAVKIVAYSNVANTSLSSQSHFQMAKIAGF